MRRRKSLRIGVHHADALVWGPVYRTRLSAQARETRKRQPRELVRASDAAVERRGLRRQRARGDGADERVARGDVVGAR